MLPSSSGEMLISSGNPFIILWEIVSYSAGNYFPLQYYFWEMVHPGKMLGKWFAAWEMVCDLGKLFAGLENYAFVSGKRFIIPLEIVYYSWGIVNLSLGKLCIPSKAFVSDQAN